MTEFLATVQPAAPAPANPANQPALAEPSGTSFTEDGYFRYVSGPPGHQFPPTLKAPGQPHAAARAFLNQHGRLFGVTSPAVDFAHLKTRSRNNRHYVRLEQTYAGIPVFAAQATVQLNAQDGIECVLSDIERNFKDLDEKRLSTVPRVSEVDAAAQARQAVAPDAGGWQLQTTPPRLTIFAPSVLDERGNLRLVWQTEVSSADFEVNEQVLIDAHSAAVVRRYPLVYPALNRQVYDATNTTAEPGGLRRSEGQAAANIPEVDNAYDFLGHTYNFYRNQHGRDSIDGSGMTLSATVRRCSTTACPWANASWGGGRMRFGDGWAVDDILAHEYTHGVTENESGLIYANVSGAINESFSDIWGEFVDLGNGAGNDSAAVRWLIGEDLTATLRNMQYPTNFSHPDRLSSPFYYTGTNDFGGVHINSGVNNKLCYLLTDGDTFNSQTVYGMGIGAVANLYYEANANLLTAGANWTDLYNALRQAAVNLGWSTSDRDNLRRACLAVEITSNLYVDKNNFCLFPNGERNCSLGFGGPFPTVAQGVAAAAPGATLFIRAGNYTEALMIEKTVTLQNENGTVTIGP